MLVESSAASALTLIATGSEVGLAVAAAERLGAREVWTRVVSMPAPQLFLAQEGAWRDRVLPPGGRRVTLEAGATDYWWRFTGPEDLRIGIDRFGASAPLAALQQHFGFTAEAVADRIAGWASGDGRRA